jgi:acetylcholinesterase
MYNYHSIPICTTQISQIATVESVTMTSQPNYFYSRSAEPLDLFLSTMVESAPSRSYRSVYSRDFSTASSSAATPQPLLPKNEFRFPANAPMWTRSRNSTRFSLKSPRKQTALAVCLLTALAPAIFGFTHTRIRDKGDDHTLKAPDKPLLVSLPGYGTFSGVQVVQSAEAKTPFAEPVDAWLGVEYSTQPVNKTRFAYPDWPKKFDGTRDASKYGKTCIQASGFDPNLQAEACLSFNLYRPNGVSSEKKLPVYVFFHGGSFVIGSSRSFDGATFVSKSKEPLIVVTMQYRLGVLGNLPSKLFEDEGLLNLGLRDQRMLLEFVQKYVTYFGGDPDRVTLGGNSAGGHSVGIQVFHNYGNDTGKKLFSQATLSSGAPTARSFPPAQYPLYERYYREFMNMIGCSTSTNNSKTLGCIEAAPISTIAQASGKIFVDSNANITWAWQPVSNGPFLEKLGSVSGEDGTFFKIPTLLSSVTDEGSIFVPQNISTNRQFIDFMSNLQPGLTKSDLAELETLYPDPSNGTGPYANSSISTQYSRIVAAYGDYAYICPVQETAYRLAKASAPVYKARFNTPSNPPTYQGVSHGSDVSYFNGLTNVPYPEIRDIYSSYYASFIVSGDPNKYKSEQAPTWEKYLDVGGGELRVGNAERGGVGMEEEKAGIRMVQCKYWRDEARMLRMYK